MSDYIITGPSNQPLDTKFPTVEKAIDAIISQFTKEKLQQLNVISIEGKLITFKDQLWYKFSSLYPVGDIDTIKVLAATVLGEIEKNPRKKITTTSFKGCFQKKNIDIFRKKEKRIRVLKGMFGINK